jgi:hypothetical protein
LPRLASNQYPPDLCHLRSLDYRCEPLAPGLNVRDLHHVSGDVHLAILSGWIKELLSCGCSSIVRHVEGPGFDPWYY